MGLKNKKKKNEVADVPASLINWKLIEYFSPREHWGDLNYVSMRLVLAMDEFRHKVGVPLLLTPVGEGAAYCTRGHVRRSWHYVIKPRNKYAKAVDYFPLYCFIEVLEKALDYPKWKGVGAYPFAKYKTKHHGTIYGMLHTDMRTTRGKIWYRTKEGKYIACSDKIEFLRVVKKLYEEVLRGIAKGGGEV